MLDAQSQKEVQQEVTISEGEQNSLRQCLCVTTVEGHGEVSRAHRNSREPTAAVRKQSCQIYLFLLNIIPEHRSKSVHLQKVTASSEIIEILNYKR